MERLSNEPDKSPLTQDDQPDQGAINGAEDRQQDANRDLARGSEPQTRGSSGGR